MAERLLVLGKEPKTKSKRQMGSRGDSWIQRVRQRIEPDADGWVRVRGLSLPDAQDLLDWLDLQAVAGRDLFFEPAEGFTVRWLPSQPDLGLKS
jgi:hypothetical protein